MLPVFQLNVDEGQSVNHQRHVKTPVPLGQLVLPCFLQRLILVDHLINAAAAGDVLLVEHHQVQGFVAPLDMDVYRPVLPHQPPSRIVEGGKVNLVFHLLELGIRQRHIVQFCLIVLLQNVAQVVPQRRLRSQLRAVCPLGLTKAELFYEFFLDAYFQFRHGSGLLYEQILEHKLFHLFQGFQFAGLEGEEGVEAI